MSIKLGIVGLILLEDVVNGSEQHSCNGNDSFFVTPALFYVVVAIANLRIAFLANRAQRTLNKQRFDVSARSADSGSFLFSGALIVLRCKTRPRTKVLGGREHGHIHADFRDNADSGKGLNTRHRHNKLELSKLILSNRKDNRFQIGFADFKSIHVRTDNAELFSLFDTHFSVHSGKDLFVSCF